MDIEHSCPEVQINTEQEEPALDRNSLLAVLVDRMEPVQIFQHRPFTCIQIRTWYNRNEYMTFGFSYLRDNWDEDRASDLAVKQAVLMAYTQIRSRERSRGRQNAYELLLKEMK